MFSTTLALILSTASTLVLAQGPFITSCGPKTWALTFDDGPYEATSELLGYLNEANVKATFFVVGAQLSQPHLRVHTKAAYDSGHMIASHSQNHLNFTELSLDEMGQQLSQVNAEIKTTIGFETNYFRPPFGECNAACADYVKQQGYTVVNWNVDTKDYEKKAPAEHESAFAAFTTALESTSASVGHISLQHDFVQFSVDMVPRIIKAIADAGNTFVTVDKCAPGLPPPYRNAPTTPTTLPRSTPGVTAVPENKASASSASVSLLVGSVLVASLAVI